jgi:ketopantoate reductase
MQAAALLSRGRSSRLSTYQQMTFGELDGPARAASACAICALRPASGILFTGKVVELGRRHGIPTPVNGFIYAALKPFISGTPT